MREILGEAPGRPYSRGTRKGNMVFVSGQLGWDADDDPIPGGVGPQTRQALEYVKEVLALAGATLDDVTMVNIYLDDLDRDYAEMNAVYREYFGDDRLPARHRRRCPAGQGAAGRDLLHRRRGLTWRSKAVAAFPWVRGAHGRAYGFHDRKLGARRIRCGPLRVISEHSEFNATGTSTAQHNGMEFAVRFGVGDRIESKAGPGNPNAGSVAATTELTLRS